LQVAASITPVQSLVASVMAGRGEPVLLIPPGQSEHTSTLRPSGAEALSEATLVFRIARGFETALDKPIDSLAASKSVIELARSPGIKLLPSRAVDQDHQPIVAAKANDLFLWADLHIWLDPQMAKLMVAEIVHDLSTADPAGAGVFAANGVKVSADLDALDARTRARLQPYAKVPFIVFHDAYQYFEFRYPLSQAGIVEVEPGRSPSARHLSDLRDKIVSAHAACVFAEPQFEPRLLATLTEGLKVRTGTLDPLGVDIPAGPGLYDALVDHLTTSLISCLGH
jgi:zinc transport system substrate-binding protein